MVTRHVLSDGTQVTIRPIEAGDKQELQGLGLGTLLADRLAAAIHGVRRFSAEMLGDNHAAQRLMERLQDSLQPRLLGA